MGCFVVLVNWIHNSISKPARLQLKDPFSFCVGLTKARAPQGTASCHWAEPSFPATFHRIPRATRYLEGQIMSSQMFLWPRKSWQNSIENRQTWRGPSLSGLLLKRCPEQEWE